MRRFLMAVAVAAAAFTLTAAGAAGVYNNVTPKTASLPALAKQAVVLNTCNAAAVDFELRWVTDEASANYGLVHEIDVVVTSEPGVADTGTLDNCDRVKLKKSSSGTYSGYVTFGAVQFVDADGPGQTAADYYKRTATVSSASSLSFLPTASISTLYAVIEFVS